MKILVVNANTDPSMTESIGAAAARYASPGTEIVAMRPNWGPASLEGWFDATLSAAALLELLSTIDVDGLDAVVLAGFADPGVDGGREILPCSVFDIAECAAQLACHMGDRYSVLATLDRSVPAIERHLRGVGLWGRCASVRPAGIGVLDLRKDPDATLKRLAEVGRQAIEVDGAEVLVLGCAGMGGIDKALEGLLDVPVIDGVVAAVKLAEACHGYGITTSRSRSYQRPRPKEILGWPTQGEKKGPNAAAPGEIEGGNDD